MTCTPNDLNWSSPASSPPRSLWTFWWPFSSAGASHRPLPPRMVHSFFRGVHFIPVEQGDSTHLHSPVSPAGKQWGGTLPSIPNRPGMIINKSINHTINENILNNFSGLDISPYTACICFPCLSPPNMPDDKRVHSVHRSQAPGRVCGLAEWNEGSEPSCQSFRIFVYVGGGRATSTHTDRSKWASWGTWKSLLQSQMPQPWCGKILVSSPMSEVGPWTQTSQFADFVQKW